MLLFIASLLAAFLAGALQPLLRRRWRRFADTHWLGTPRPMRQPWVIDGDTIEDRSTGARYRLANIDAPETGDNAKCFKEAERGELAKWAAVRLVRSAASVTVRPTVRVDPYGRRVAYVLVDDEDLGEILVQRGLAMRWQGRRSRWCGSSGGLMKIAESGAMAHRCRTCRDWR